MFAPAHRRRTCVVPAALVVTSSHPAPHASSAALRIGAVAETSGYRYGNERAKWLSGNRRAVQDAGNPNPLGDRFGPTAGQPSVAPPDHPAERSSTSARPPSASMLSTISQRAARWRSSAGADSPRWPPVRAAIDGRCDA
uniref:Putative secreted protein n=1 Tax=Anopheles marajoara TaxID=58244 RepID=A0A2M4C7M9_9DIPT